jgi:hypothetical protein
LHTNTLGGPTAAGGTLKLIACFHGFIQIFTPLLHWIEGKQGPAPRPVPYPYGSRGPKELDDFVSKYGFKRNDNRA